MLSISCCCTTTVCVVMVAMTIQCMLFGSFKNLCMYTRQACSPNGTHFPLFKMAHLKLLTFIQRTFISAFIHCEDSATPLFLRRTCLAPPIKLESDVINLGETIDIRTPAIIGRSYTETKPCRYSVKPRKGRRSPPYFGC